MMMAMTIMVMAMTIMVTMTMVMTMQDQQERKYQMSSSKPMVIAKATKPWALLSVPCWPSPSKSLSSCKFCLDKLDRWMK